MAANQVSTIEALTGAEDYFLKVMKPNYDAYFGASSTFASAFNLATTLFHFHEWPFDQYKPQLEQNFNITFGQGPVLAGDPGYQRKLWLYPRCHECVEACDNRRVTSRRPRRA